MWHKWLLSLAGCLLCSAAKAQQPAIYTEQQRDSALHFIYRHYSYTSPEYQSKLDTLLQHAPDFAQAWQQKSMPNIKRGNYEQCFINLQHASALEPKTWLSYQAFLKCIFVKDYRAALTDFESCEHLMPRTGVMDHSFGFFRGLCYLGLDSLVAAQRFLEEDVAIQERRMGVGEAHHLSLFYLGYCYYSAGKDDLAITRFLQCLKAYPQYPEPNYYLGLLLNKQDKKADAIAYLRKAKAAIAAGYNSNEDQEFYINYPFEITDFEVNAALDDLNRK